MMKSVQNNESVLNNTSVRNNKSVLNNTSVQDKESAQDNETDQKDGAVVIFSGGQDSTTCLFLAEKVYGKENIIPVSFFYGQRHAKELEAAEKICREFGFHGISLPLDFLNTISVSSLTEKTGPIDTEIPEGENYPNTFVPGRNLFFLTIAGVIAKNNGYHHVITGVSEVDFSGYPDCRENFIRSAEETITFAMDYDIKIHTPLMHKTKAQIWKTAEELGIIDLVHHETVTCYNGILGEGCGDCLACALRRKGWEEYKDGKY